MKKKHMTSRHQDTHTNTQRQNEKEMNKNQVRRKYCINTVNTKIGHVCAPKCRIGYNAISFFYHFPNLAKTTSGCLLNGVGSFFRSTHVKHLVAKGGRIDSWLLCSDLRSQKTYSGSNPSLRAFCLFCCLCLSFNSFNYTEIISFNDSQEL